MTDIEKKKAHALEVVAKLQEVFDTIDDHEEGLWFGGYPPLYVQMQNFVTHMKGQLATVFGLPQEEEGTE